MTHTLSDTAPRHKPLSKAALALIAEAQEVPIRFSAPGHTPKVIMQKALFDMAVEGTDLAERLPHKLRSDGALHCVLLEASDFAILKDDLDSRAGGSMPLASPPPRLRHEHFQGLNAGLR